MSEIIGLDIGSYSIKLVGLKKTSRGPFLTCLGVRKVPQGVAKGDIDSVSGILKDLVKEVGLKTKKARVIVSGAGIHIRRVTMPSIPKKELSRALSWKMKDLLPFPVETARIQFHIQGEFVEEGIKKLDLLIVASPSDLVDQTLSMVQWAGLQVSHLDVSAFALWNMLLNRDRLKIGENVALIDLGSKKMSLYLFKDEILQFTREMTPAGDDLTRAIMDGIPSEKDPHLLYEKAERIKEEVGILPSSRDRKEGDEKIDLPKISFLMRPVLERWVAEIGRSLDYYRNQFYGEKVDRIFLTGGGAHLKGFATYLEGALGLSVETFNPLKEMPYDANKTDRQVPEQIGSMFTAALGVALSDPKQIEFLPAEEPFWAKIPLAKLFFILAPMITALIFIGIIWYKTNQITALQSERDEKTAKIAKLEGMRARWAMLKEKETRIKQDLSLFPSSVTLPLPYQQVLQEVNRIIPSNIVLTYLEIQSGAKPFKKVPRGSKSQEVEAQQKERKVIHLSGLAFGSDIHCLTAIAQIIESLERSSLFSHVKLISTDENKSYNRPATEFDIVCDIDSTPPPSAHGRSGPNKEKQ